MSRRYTQWSQLFGAGLTALAVLVPGAAPAAAQAQTPAGCQFVLGFGALRDLVGAGVAGDCLENQRFAPNGNAEQRTAGGLMAWRKADNWTAFTDGFRTWLNGPNGLQQRLNTQRFTWEPDAGAPGTTLFVPSAQPTDVRAIRAVAAVNVRSGPGQAFGTLSTIPAGRTEAVTGVSPDAQWWRVTCPDGSLGSCWASAATNLTQPVPIPLDLSGLPGPGQRVDGGLIALTVGTVQRTATPTTTLRAEPGKLYILADVTIENPSDSPVAYAPEDFDIRGPEGTDFAAAGGIGPNPLARGQIAPGGTVRGQVAFVIPDQERGLILNYKPNVAFGTFPTIRVALD